MEEFSTGLFNDFVEGKSLPQNITSFEDEENYRRKLGRVWNIYAAVRGENRLRRALYIGKQIEINALLEVYRKDFDRVRNHLVVKFGCDAEDKFWLRKTVLVASTEEECRSAKSLENLEIDAEDLRQAVIVLLLHPVEGDEVAVLHPNETSRSAVAKLIKILIPNGLLSWNIFDANGNKETVMEIAASRGLSYVIDRLYDTGVEIATNSCNPLLYAITHKKKKTVKWLLSRHFDHFDCTLRDNAGRNALIAAMLGNSADMFDLVLEKMIAYRKKYFQETEEEAFREIFLFDHKDYDFSNALRFGQKNGPFLERLEQAIQRYNLKLSHQWSHYVVLGRLIERGIALNYCFEAIRKDPELLGLKEEENTTILQTILQSGHLEFVHEMYTKNPEVKSYFNTDSAFGLMKNAIMEQNCALVGFVLEHHEEFLKSDLDKLKDHVVFCPGYTHEFYEIRYDLLKECLPELLERIEELRKSPEKDNNIDCNHEYVSINSSLVKLLHSAVEKDDKELFIRMLEAGCELDSLDNDGNHPVHLVRSEEMLELIINRHPEGRNVVHRTNNEGFTILHNVCQQYMAHKLLEKVIQYGANVHQLTKNGESAVFFAWDCQMLDVLRKHGAQVDTTNNQGKTALEQHFFNGNLKFATQLFRYVHDLPSFKQHAHKYLASMVESYGRLYNTHEYQVIFKDYSEAARIMLNAAYEQSREEASRLFCKACSTGFWYVTEMFLDGGYDLDFNYSDTHGITPLLGVANYMPPAIVHNHIERLLDKGVDLLARDKYGRNVLKILVERYPTAHWDGLDLETLQLLLDHGAEINAVDREGNTPLHFAFQEKEIELVEVLFKNGADPRMKNNLGKRPLGMTSALYQDLFYFYFTKYTIGIQK